MGKTKFLKTFSKENHLLCVGYSPTMNQELGITTIPVMHKDLLAFQEIALSVTLNAALLHMQERGDVAIGMVHHIPEWYQGSYDTM